MLYFPKWKIYLIWAVCVLGILFTLPNFFPSADLERVPKWLPHQQVNLGLDLRGGSHLLLQVDLGAVLHERLDDLVESVRKDLQKDRIGYVGLGIANHSVKVKIREPNQFQTALSTLQGLSTPLTGGFFGGSGQRDLLVAGGPDNTITMTLTDQAIEQKAQSALQQSIEIVRRRVDETGVNEPEIQREGDDRIVVELPGIHDPDRVKRLIGKTAKLTFQMVDLSPGLQPGQVPPGDELLPSSDEKGADGKPVQYLVRRRVEVSGDNLKDAQAEFDSRNGQAIVNFRFDSIGAKRFGDVTRENVGKPFAIVLDSKVISAPVIREPILGGSGQISGNFTPQSANDLAVLLRAGALPAPLKIIEERTVGPDLGADSIHSGLEACIVGFVLVVAYMFLAYGFFGAFANIALIFNLFLVMAALSVLQATLTLPGIAGILLTIGMAVDANVLINERIREESKLGKSPLAAMDAGFARAFGTILDANLTTLIKMGILYAFGSGTVKGFAVTISIGIITSMFTAILLTRMLMVFWLRRRRPAALPI